MIALVWPIKITGLSRLQKHSKTDCWDSNSQDISWPEKKMAETDDTNNVPEGQLAALNGCSNQLRGFEFVQFQHRDKTLKSLKGSSPQRAKTMPPSYNLAKSGKCFTSDDSHYSWSNPACWFFRPCFVDGNHIRSISCRSLPPITDESMDTVAFVSGNFQVRPQKMVIFCWLAGDFAKFIWLVVWNPTPLKNMTSSVGIMKFPTEWKNKSHGPNHPPAIITI